MSSVPDTQHEGALKCDPWSDEDLNEGGDAVEDAAWDVQDHDPRVVGEDFVEDIATSLGYEGFDL